VPELIDIRSETTQQKHGRLVNPGGHAAQCTICQHPNRADIEDGGFNGSIPKSPSSDKVQ